MLVILQRHFVTLNTCMFKVFILSTVEEPKIRMPGVGKRMIRLLIVEPFTLSLMIKSWYIVCIDPHFTFIRFMHTPLVDEFTCDNPFLVDEVDTLLDQLGECITAEVLIRVDKRLEGKRTQKKQRKLPARPEKVLPARVIAETPAQPEKVLPARVIAETPEPTKVPPARVIAETPEPTKVPPARVIAETPEPTKVPPARVIAETPEPMKVPPARVVVEVPEPMKVPPARVVVEAPEPMKVPPARVVVETPEPTKVPPARVVVEAPEPMKVPPARVVAETPEPVKATVKVAAAESTSFLIPRARSF